MMERQINETPALSGELRPVRMAFLFQRLAPVALIIVVLTTVAAIAIQILQPGGLFALFAVGGGVVLLAVWLVVAGYWANAAYAKERYEFLLHRIIAHRGSPISDQTTELTIRNITHVKRRLPWPRYALFGVGDVMIESAGSEASEIILRTISRPNEVYEGVAALMQDNGFRLSRDNRLHEEKPDVLGVVIECAGMILGTLIATVIAIGELYLDREDAGLISLGLSLLPLLGIVAIGLHYLDMRRRVYRVYDDTVVYEEGFLTRDDAFIPGENIADSSTRRGLLDMILGLYDVRISCQGSQAEIQFRRLRRGAALADAVDHVVSHSSTIASVVPTDESDGEPVGAVAGNSVRSCDAPSATPATGRAKRPQRIPAEKCWTATLQPSPLRYVAPYLVLCVIAFPLAPIWVVVIVRGLIAAVCTHYLIRPTSVQERFQFLHSTERDFSYEKVTGAVISENPIDRMLGTVTISIWSIGSAQPLELKHVVRQKVQLNALLRQLGIPPAEVIEQIPARFSVNRMILATIPWQGALGVLILGVLALAAMIDWRWLLILVPVAIGVGGVIVHRWIYYSRCSVTMHRAHLECREGWLWRHHFLARHDNIKRVELTRYPWSDVGTLRFVVAGEHRPGSSPYAQRKSQSRAQSGFGARSYGFQVRYAEQLSRHRTAIDERLADDPPTEVAVEHESRPALANSLTAPILISILLLPLALLLPVVIPWVVLAVRRRRYFIESHRVLMTSGIVYRKQASVLHDRIDSIRHDRHLLGKLFGNGNVTVFTAGSSQPDLELKNAPDYRELYAILQKHYTD